jgi:type II secretory pathway pseudopilin PulG
MKRNLIVLAIMAVFSTASLASNNQPQGGDSNASANANQSQGQGQSQQQAQGQGQAQGQVLHNSNDIRNTNTNLNSNSNRNENSNTNSNRNTNTAVAGAAAFSGSKSSSGGNTMSSSISNDTDIRPAASAPSFALTSVGSYNCLGSASLSAGNGFFSFGGGTTMESVECNRRANSDQLIKLGQPAAALALVCLNDEVAKVTPACKKDTPAAPVVASAAAPTYADRPVAAKVTPTADVVRAAKLSTDPQKDWIVCERTGERC